MNQEKKSRISVEKLIRFFRGLSGRKAEVTKDEYKGWDQTEEEYQKEQAEWLRQIEEKSKRQDR